MSDWRDGSSFIGKGYSLKYCKVFWETTDLEKLVVEWKIKKETERTGRKLLLISYAWLRRILNRGQQPATGVNTSWTGRYRGKTLYNQFTAKHDWCHLWIREGTATCNGLWHFSPSHKMRVIFFACFFQNMGIYLIQYSILMHLHTPLSGTFPFKWELKEEFTKCPLCSFFFLLKVIYSVWSLL